MPSGSIRAKFTTTANHLDASPRNDFHVLVPIYGSIQYLENIDYLATYSNRVVLCTTTHETAEFYEELQRIALRHDFTIFYGQTDDQANQTGKRQTGGTTRDKLVRDVLPTLSLPYVVCIDADTVTEKPLGELVGAMAAGGYDLVSVPLKPKNQETWLGRLQAHEYRVAMALRRIMPWMVSGGCHAARTSALADVMNRHSLFFQGNDIEIGVIADALGYRVGHIPFQVPTTVPVGLRPWFRQRLAWAGGEFRLFMINCNLIRRHPILWAYGIVIMFLGLALRWYTAATTPRIIGAVLAIYLILALFINWRQRDRWLLLLPFYAAISSLIMLTLALPSYLWMASKSHNAGIILKKSRGRDLNQTGVLNRPAAPAATEAQKAQEELCALGTST